MSIKKILIVDDEEQICALFDIYLSDLGYQVVQAQDGVEALDIIAAESPDLAFIDIKMPNMNGIDLMDALNEQGSKLPVIIISGFSTESLAREALAKGAFDYIGKPIELTRVSEIISCVELLGLDAGNG